MNYKDLADWVKGKNPNEQVSIVLEDEGDFPFTAYFVEKHERTIVFEEALWESEDFESYTWGQLLEFCNNLKNQDVEVTAMVAWHCLKVKILDDKLYTGGECIKCT